MHFFGSNRSRYQKLHAYFDLPDNPICWLKGHTPTGKIVEPKYIDPYLVIRCKICDRRYSEDVATTIKSRASVDDWKELYRRRLDIFAQDSKSYLKHNVEVRGAGWGVGKLELNAEIAYPESFRPDFSFRLHTGGRGSETPYDAHFVVGGWGAYLSIGGLSGRWAEFIGRGHGRDIALSMHGQQLWWKLWYDGDGGNDQHHRCDTWRQPKLWPWSRGRQKYRGWMCLRDGHIPINPVSAFYGQHKFLLAESGEPREAVVDIGQFPGDEYVAMFRLDYREIKRDQGPAWARRVKGRYPSVEWDASAVGGIPHRNHDWKGDEVISGNLRSSVLDGWDGQSDWLPLAIEGLKADILRDRERYHYRPSITIE